MKKEIKNKLEKIYANFALRTTLTKWNSLLDDIDSLGEKEKIENQVELVGFIQKNYWLMNDVYRLLEERIGISSNPLFSNAVPADGFYDFVQMRIENADNSEDVIYTVESNLKELGDSIDFDEFFRHLQNLGSSPDSQKYQEAIQYMLKSKVDHPYKTSALMLYAFRAAVNKEKVDPSELEPFLNTARGLSSKYPGVEKIQMDCAQVAYGARDFKFAYDLLIPYREYTNKRISAQLAFSSFYLGFHDQTVEFCEKFLDQVSDDGISRIYAEACEKTGRAPKDYVKIRKEEQKDFYKVLNGLLEDGRTGDAYQYTESMICKDYTFVPAYVEQQKICFAEKNYQAVVNLGYEIQSLDPKIGGAYVLSMRAYIDCNQIEDAEKLYKDAKSVEGVRGLEPAIIYSFLSKIPGFAEKKMEFDKFKKLAEKSLQDFAVEVLKNRGELTDEDEKKFRGAFTLESPKGFSPEGDEKKSLSEFYTEIGRVCLLNKFNFFSESEAVKYISLGVGFDPENIEARFLLLKVYSNLISRNPQENCIAYGESFAEHVAAFEEIGGEVTSSMKVTLSLVQVKIYRNIPEMEKYLEEVKDDSEVTGSKFDAIYREIYSAAAETEGGEKYREKVVEMDKESAMGLVYFLAILFDTEKDEEAKAFIDKNFDRLKVFGFDSPDKVISPYIYRLCGRKNNGDLVESSAGNSFSLDPRIEKAIEIIYIDVDESRADEAKNLLESAMNDGDPNAMFFLGRTCLGECFVPEAMGYEEDEDLGMEYFNLSIEKGSPYGMFAARRLGGFRPRCGKYLMPPFKSETELFGALYKHVVAEDVFASYLIANALYYGDFMKMLGIEPTEENLRFAALAAVKLYHQQLRCGLKMGRGNAIDILTSGDYGIKPDPQYVAYLRSY